MDVRALSKRVFESAMSENLITDENVEEKTDIFVISICNTSGTEFFSESYFRKEHENVAIFKFDDVEHDGEMDPFGKAGIAFTPEMADKMIAFIDKHRNKSMCLIHCAAGVSRSGAVARFINGYCQGDYNLFKRNNSQIVPNGRVERMLNMARRERQEIKKAINEKLEKSGY